MHFHPRIYQLNHTRHHIDIDQDINNKQETQDVDKNFKELCDRTLKLKSLENWKIDCTEDYLCLRYILSPYLVPRYELLFGKDLSFVIVIFGCSIPTTHEIYGQNGNIVKNISVPNLLIKLFNYDICSGIKDYNSNETTQHIAPCETDPNALLQNRTATSNLNILLYIPSTKCEFLCLSNICKECSTIKPVKKSQAKIDAPVKANAPLSKTHPKRTIIALQEEQNKKKRIGKCNCSNAKRNI